MEYKIIRLSNIDYGEAIDFINMVFSMNYYPCNFPEMLPVLYKPTEEHIKFIREILLKGDDNYDKKNKK
jgi:hypothetical protein